MGVDLEGLSLVKFASVSFGIVWLIHFQLPVEISQFVGTRYTGDSLEYGLFVVG